VEVNGFLVIEIIGVSCQSLKSLVKLFKACGFQRQRLWSHSAEGEIPFIQRSVFWEGCISLRELREQIFFADNVSDLFHKPKISPFGEPFSSKKGSL